MPASTMDPVSTALRSALSTDSTTHILRPELCGSVRKILDETIEFECAENYKNPLLEKLKSKYTVFCPEKTPPATPDTKCSETNTEEAIAEPKRILYPLDAVQLGWNNAEWSVGSGLVNMGNTCYMNSTLQALFHVPALVNWLLSDKQHMIQCDITAGGQTGCIICAMSKTLQASQQKNASAIRPWLVFSRLRIVCRHLVPGRQEDAHEFLRYLVEAMECAYIKRFRHNGPLDSRSKETTPLNQILGGYLRSTVRCLECGHVSTTFQHFQDLLLDIRKVCTLDDALDLYFAREKLDDMAYHCENCQKKVHATKQFFLERAPMVLCVQLKRFSLAMNKITKHIAFRQRLELTRFTRRKPSAPLVYRLVSIVTHVGQTAGCGHYTAVAQVPSGHFYQFDDNTVRPISHQSVFNTNAYIILYELEDSQNNISSSKTSMIKSFNVQKAESTSHLIKDATPSLHVVNNNTPSSSTSSKILNSTTNQNGNGYLNGVQNHADNSSESDDSERNVQKSFSNSPKPVVNNPKPVANNPKPVVNNLKPVVNSPKPVVTNSLSENKQNPVERKPLKPFDSNVAPTKLVPYDDDSSSNEEPSTSAGRSQIGLNTGSWQVSTNVNRPSLFGHTGVQRRNDTVKELMQMSHEGYGAPVNSWNGNRSALDRNLANQRHEDRKRGLMERMDRRQIKRPKYNGHSNPGYNPFQEYNFRNWQNDTHYYKPYYNNNNNNNNRHRYQKRGSYQNRPHDNFRH